MPKRRCLPPESNNIRGDRMKISCPHCSQSYDIDRTSIGKEADCTSCGNHFVIQATVSKPPKSVELSHCPYCAGELVPGVKKCRHCGEWIDISAKPKDPVIYVILGLFGNLLALHNFYEGKAQIGCVKIVATILGFIGFSMSSEIPQIGIFLILPFFVFFCINMYEITHCDRMLSRSHFVKINENSVICSNSKKG